jgi:hypothetical protein
MALLGVKEYEVTRIHKDLVGGLQLIVKGLVEPALEHCYGELTFNDLIDIVVEDRAQLWLVFETEHQGLVAACTTQVVKYPQLKALRVITLGGTNMHLWARDLDDALIQFAKDHGCTRMEAFGRKGLARRLEELAFTVMYTAYGKEIE